jgi:hypothetical protein
MRPSTRFPTTRFATQETRYSGSGAAGLQTSVSGLPATSQPPG